MKNHVFLAKPYRTILLTAIALITTLGLTQGARADTVYYFSINNTTGIDASGLITVSNTGPLGASTVTGITGTFSDAANNISGAITGLNFAPPPTFNLSPPAAPNTFGAPAFTSAGFSYDNLFWPDADSPAVCTDALAFYGGYFDVYGMAFNVAGGYTVDLWSDGQLGGYQLNDSFNSVPFSPNNIDGLAYAVDVTASPVPEPGTLFLFGTGLSGMAALWRRRKEIV
ncbi:PEP-CTERM sorting domain-containing protein [Edaphobacter albus]|uniref:PEP-CTERM sorting domain-containing protein n=1 Tax=Edaphobacter sp. 4G125 TaxID=2763071 RepID=UPI0016440EFF|nr:PEP-CTERM sorting domain-containing protein [Edaphobacter sp. 4G125]QNI37195.1 PEP-CTERM sorting domain-containing protein [Edaphobacter sp. 4G125]